MIDTPKSETVEFVKIWRKSDFGHIIETYPLDSMRISPELAELIEKTSRSNHRPTPS